MDPEGFEPVRSPLVRVDLLNVFKIKSGPRGIRTLDLLNAIETRSQLRYGPNIIFFDLAAPANSSIRCLPAHDGPGGIRTLDLFSAIEARSQLRYRPDDQPILQGEKILPEWGVNVKLKR